MIALATWVVTASTALAAGAPPTVIPAYAHNDYQTADCKVKMPALPEGEERADTATCR